MEQQADSDLLKKELYGLFKYPAAGAPGNRRDQQAVVTAGVATQYRAGREGSGAVSQEPFTVE